MARTKKTYHVKLQNVGILSEGDGFALDAITEDGRRVLVHMNPIQMMEIQDRIRRIARHSWVQDRIRAAYVKLLGRAPERIPHLDSI